MSYYPDLKNKQAAKATAASVSHSMEFTPIKYGSNAAQKDISIQHEVKGLFHETSDTQHFDDS